MAALTEWPTRVGFAAHPACWPVLFKQDTSLRLAMAVPAPTLETERLRLLPIPEVTSLDSFSDALSRKELFALYQKARNVEAEARVRAVLERTPERITPGADEATRAGDTEYNADQLRRALDDEERVRPLTQPTTEEQQGAERQFLAAFRGAVYLDWLSNITGRTDVMAHYVDSEDDTAGWPRQKTLDFINKNAASWTERGIGCWNVFSKEDNRLVGFAGFQQLDWIPEIEPAVELSYYIDPPFWGKGLGPEAISVGLDWLFRHDSVVACIVDKNKQSIRGVEKLGFNQERLVPYTNQEYGRSATFSIYRVTAENWRARRSPDWNGPQVGRDNVGLD